MFIYKIWSTSDLKILSKLSVENFNYHKVMKINLYAADSGDFMQITSSQGNIILIDGGTPICQKIVYDALLKISQDTQKLKAWAVTHNHNDHYGGLLGLLRRKNGIGWDWLYNSPLMGAVTRDTDILTGDVFTYDDIKITIVGPNKKALESYRTDEKQKLLEMRAMIAKADYNQKITQMSLTAYDDDDSLCNATSLAFIVECGGKSILMLGDAPSKQTVENLKTLGYSSRNRLIVDAVKVSHHGSKHNTSNEFLSIVKTNKYLFSCNVGQNQHQFPTKNCIARILRHNKRDRGQKVTLYFNYPCHTIFRNEADSMKLLNYDYIGTNFLTL